MPGIPVFCLADNNCLYAGGVFNEQSLKIQQDAKSQKTKQPDKRCKNDSLHKKKYENHNKGQRWQRRARNLLLMSLQLQVEIPPQHLPSQQEISSMRPRRKYQMVLKLKLILSPLCCFFSCKPLQMCSKYGVGGEGGTICFAKSWMKTIS